MAVNELVISDHPVRARGPVTGRLGLIGPAFVAAVAYVDPGNFATNVTAGARHGYVLVWVVVLANLMAMLIQYLSAKIGVVTGRDLPELCRDHFPRTVTRGLWIQAELIAIATDLAEFVGAAVGLNLLLGVPLFPAGVITAVVASGLLVFQQRGYRHFELAITGLLGLVLLGLCYNLSSIHLSPGPAARGLVPAFDGSGSLLLAAGIIGATVMPHAVYLHSGLTKNRVIPASNSERHRLLRFQRIDVIAGLTGAGFINLALILVAASLFHRPGSAGIATIESAHAELGHLIGGAAALAFAIALFASGVASSSVGTYAGQIVMQGFIHRKIPIWTRRALTAGPALLVLALGSSTTTILLLSQVVLSFGIPFALIPMIILTRRRDIMGAHVNRTFTTITASAIAALIIALNIYLLYDTLVA